MVMFRQGWGSGEGRDGLGVGGTAGGGERKMPRNKAFTLQVSLELGVTMLIMDKKGDKVGGITSNCKDDAKILRRGKNLGFITTGNPVARKGDFNLFQTKSTLTKQNLLMPQGKEADHDLLNSTDAPHGGENDSINKSVPFSRLQRTSSYLRTNCGRSSSDFRSDALLSPSASTAKRSCGASSC